MNRIILFPCNGNAIEAIDCIGNKYFIEGFIDDSPVKQDKIVHGYRVFSRSTAVITPETKLLLVPGRAENFLERKVIIDSLSIPFHQYASIAHPNAVVSRFSHVGVNTLIMAGVVITSNSLIGNHVCILPNTVIHHDVEIGEYTLIGSNVTIAGNVKIGNNSYIGSGSTIKNNVSIGDRTLIGMCSNVINSIPSGCVAYGNPAVIKDR